MIKYNLQYFGGRGASGTMKSANGKKISGNKVAAIRVNANGTILTYRDMGKNGIADITGFNPKDTDMSINQLAERAKNMGYEVIAYTAKEVQAMDEKRKNKPTIDWELGYGVPWGNKEYRKTARRNRLATRAQKRRR